MDGGTLDLGLHESKTQDEKGDSREAIFWEVVVLGREIWPLRASRGKVPSRGSKASLWYLCSEEQY